jgi:hypothetical protein
MNYIWESHTKSSVKILPESLKSNQTYQFMVHMINQKNPSLQSIGYLDVEVNDLYFYHIVIG